MKKKPTKEQVNEIHDHAVSEMKSLIADLRTQLRNSAERIEHSNSEISTRIALTEKRMMELAGHVNDLNVRMAQSLDNYMRVCGLIQFLPGKQNRGAKQVEMIADLLARKESHKPPHA